MVLSNAFISLNDIINNFIISYTGPGKLIPDAKRTEVIFHARRCLQEFAYETLKSQMEYQATIDDEVVITTPISGTFQRFQVPSDSVTAIKLTANGTTLTQVDVAPVGNQYYVDYTKSPNIIYFPNSLFDNDLVYQYLSNALTVDELASIPKLAEEALYACMIYAILANRENTDPNLLQRLLIEKIDKLERSKSRLIFTNFT